MRVGAAVSGEVDSVEFDLSAGTDAAPAMCTLVAHHTGAVAEAAERGLSEPLLAEFPLNGHGEQVIAVTYCDLTTGPRGERLSPQERIAEILSRYEPGGAVHRAPCRCQHRICSTSAARSPPL